MTQPLLQRRSPRLKGYDYSQSGVYFVTICTDRRLQLLGSIQDGMMNLNDLGKVAAEELAILPNRWKTVDVDLFVVMPNHLHAIVILVGTPFLASETTKMPDSQTRGPTLGQIIGNFKAGVTRIVRERVLLPVEAESGQLWQGRYHDHIVRDEQALNRIRSYIAENPARWTEDTFFGPET